MCHSFLKSDKHSHGPWSVSAWIRHKHSNYSIYKNASSQVGTSILDVLVIKRNWTNTIQTWKFDEYFVIQKKYKSARHKIKEQNKIYDAQKVCEAL